MLLKESAGTARKEKESRPFTPANFTALYNPPTQVCENGAESITKAKFKSIALDP